MPKIYAYRDAVQYDGTNAAAINALIGGDFEIVSDDGATLAFTSCDNVSGDGYLPHVTAGDWIVYANGCVSEILTAEQFGAAWLVAPE